MIEGSLGRRYAKALFQLAVEAGREEEVGEEVGRFVVAYSGSPLNRVIGNRSLPARSRKTVAIQVAQALELSALTTRFLSLLIDRDRMALLPSIAARYRRLLDEAKGRVEARLVGARPVDPELLEKLRAVLEKITSKKVILREESDTGLIGGVLVELEGRIYDGSVRTELEKMKARIERGY
ncbi:MAG: ATP synthase F1 subunit delta [Deltaproteobacteria bacterium]|nr:ATP synthase F1 subunit delta [Deltaproteobacteria bacterium]